VRKPDDRRRAYDPVKAAVSKRKLLGVATKELNRRSLRSTNLLPRKPEDAGRQIDTGHIPVLADTARGHERRRRRAGRYIQDALATAERRTIDQAPGELPVEITAQATAALRRSRTRYR